MKITILGPVFPYKGGISHYTGLMAKSLMKEHEVDVVSFKLQYPKFLYKKPQKDFENDSFKIENVKYLLNSINPFSCFKTANYIKEQSPDLIIFQWWHPFFSPCYCLLLKILGRKYNTIFLCHNVLPHEKFPFQKILAKSVLKKTNAYILHSKTDEMSLKELIKSPLYKKTFLPTYDTFNMKTITQKEARNILKIDENDVILLFFGFIREYKGLKHLIRAMPKIREQIPTCKLLIVGDFFEDNKNEYTALIDNVNCKEIIQIHDGYIPDKEVEKFFVACDLMVCPYESATQSAVIQIAYGFEKPVIATSVGGLPEVVLNDKTGYIVPPFDEKALAEAVIKYFQLNKTKEFTLNIKKETYKYSWDRMNEVVNTLFDEMGRNEN